jgi:hypothetical protein
MEFVEKIRRFSGHAIAASIFVAQVRHRHDKRNPIMADGLATAVDLV